MVWTWNALVAIGSWNLNGVMVLVWMLWSPYALGTGMELWFWYRCSGYRTHQNKNGVVVWAMMFRLSHSSKHERNYGLGMDAPVTVCSWNMNGIMVLVWRLFLSHLLKDERNYGLGMDALVTVCSWNMNGIVVWVWVL